MTIIIAINHLYISNLYIIKIDNNFNRFFKTRFGVRNFDFKYKKSYNNTYCHNYIKSHLHFR